MNNPRKIAVEVLNVLEKDHGYSNIVLNKYLKESDLEPVDRALATEIVYGTIKYSYSIDIILNKFIRKGVESVDERIINILRSAIYQLRYLDKVPSFAVVNEAVELAKETGIETLSKFVNGVLRSFARNKNIQYYSERNLIERLCFEYSFKKEMVEFFIGQYGEYITENILKGLNTKPFVTVRNNNLKEDYDVTMSKLVELGYDIEEGYAAPEALIIKKGSAIESNQLFKDGYITVQDESAMLIGELLSPKKEELILDLCAAPGGKTTHIAEIVEDLAKIVAFDIYEHKLELIKENCSRLGINSVETILQDATEIRDEYIEKADRVLCDVPCSGLGIIRKKPEIKYNKDLFKFEELIAIQRKILEVSSKYVKKDGIIIYSTCTLNKKENEENISWFIKNNKDFIIEEINVGEGDNFMYHDDKTLTILPNQYMDGFFLAKLRKIK